MLLVVLLYIICASMFTISKWGLAYTEPLFFMAVRMIGAGFLLGGYLIIKEWRNGPPDFKKMWSDSGLFVQIIIFHIFLTYICDLCALKNITSVESAFIYNLSPFIAAFFSYVWFGESMTAKKWVGLSLGFASMLPEIYHLGPGTLAAYSVPRLLTLAAVISSSYGWVVLRVLVKKGYSPILINSIGMFVGGFMALVMSFLTESWVPSPVTEWIPFIQAIILIIVVANIVFYNLYGYLLNYYTATFLSFAGFLCPFFAAFLGRFFLHETLSWHLIISFITVCIGLVLFYGEELKQGYVQK